RHVQAEERVAVAWLGTVVPGGDRVAVKAHWHLYANGTKVTVVGLEPPTQPTRHHGQHRVVDCCALGCACHAAKSLELDAGKRDGSTSPDVAVERGTEPRLWKFTRSGAQTSEPTARKRLGVCGGSRGRAS